MLWQGDSEAKNININPRNGEVKAINIIISDDGEIAGASKEKKWKAWQ